MSYTKGEWKVKEGADENNAFIVFDDPEPEIAVWTPNDNEALANARLIVAAVNGCISVNPDNPLAVAEDIKDMYETLRLTTKASDEEIIEESIQNWHNRIFGEEK